MPNFISLAGLEPATLRLEVSRAIQLRQRDLVLTEGVEPSTTAS